MNIIFKQLIITDIKEEVSKKIVFESKRNLLSSANGKGKSTIMKSLYHSLGANADFDGNIDKKSMIFDLIIEYGSIEYRVIRFVDQYLIFKNNALDMTCERGNISHLAEYYKNEFGMYVYLEDKKERLSIAPPAYSFIPYYLDQDRSWKKEQFPFDNMGQYEKTARNDLYFYHLSIYNDEYNAVKLRYKSQQLECKRLSVQHEQAISTYLQLKKDLSVEGVCVNEKEIELLIEDISAEINSKLDIFNKTKKELYSLENEQAECLCQIKNLSEVLKALDSQKKIPSSQVQCPSCGMIFEIDIEKEVKELYNKLFLQSRKEFYLLHSEKIDVQIQEKQKELNACVDEINQLESKLQQEHANYDLYTKRKAADSIFKDLRIKIGEIGSLLSQADNEAKRLKNILNESEIKTTEIKDEFRKRYIHNLTQLNVKKFNSNKIKAFEKLAIGGSQYVRSTLAFFYSFLELKKQFNKGKFQCPLVIDSPREGEQDDMNSRKIIEFIFNKYDGDEQLIVASVNGDKFIDDVEDENEIHIIRLENDDNQVMTEYGYQENLNDINWVKSYLGIH